MISLPSFFYFFSVRMSFDALVALAPSSFRRSAFIVEILAPVRMVENDMEYTV